MPALRLFRGLKREDFLAAAREVQFPAHDRSGGYLPLRGCLALLDLLRSARCPRFEGWHLHLLGSAEPLSTRPSQSSPR